MPTDHVAPRLSFGMAHRLLFTAAALLAYRLGCQIPVPGIDLDVLSRLHGSLSSEKLSLFALGVTPIFSALLLFELVKLVVPPLARWEAGEQGRARRLRRYIFMAGVAMAAFQAYSVVDALYGIPRLLDGPGWRFPIVATWVAATVLLGWLAERVTVQGMGSGFWLLLITPTLVNLTGHARISFLGWQKGLVSLPAIATAVIFIVVAVALIVATHRPRSGPRVSGADFATVWPPLLAGYLGNLVIVMFGMTTGTADHSPLAFGIAVHLLVIAALIAAFTWLQIRGIPGPRGRLADGSPKLLWIVALVQIFVCAGGELLTQQLAVPFAVDGAWLIVVVTVALNMLRTSKAEPADDASTSAR